MAMIREILTRIDDHAAMKTFPVINKVLDHVLTKTIHVTGVLDHVTVARDHDVIPGHRHVKKGRNGAQV